METSAKPICSGAVAKLLALFEPAMGREKD
jgi:hypothetical protein